MSLLDAISVENEDLHIDIVVRPNQSMQARWPAQINSQRL